MVPFQVLPLQATGDLGAMAMKEYSVFPKAPALLEPHHQIFVSHRTLIEGVLPLSRDAVKSKRCISIARNTVSLMDHSVLKVCILILPYKSTTNFAVIFFQAQKFGLYAATCNM